MPCDVLLISSEVQAKCMNSDAATNSGTSCTFSFNQYSTAFTSWLVTASIALIRCASSSVKSDASFSNNCRALAEKFGISAKPASDSASSQAISTLTLWCIKPASDKIGRKASVLDA